MTAEDDRWKAMNFEGPEYIPVGVSLLPATWRKHGGALADLAKRHPILFGDGEVDPEERGRAGGTYVEGSHVDEWGCVWTNVAEGMEAIVTGHPVATRADVHRLKAPEEITPHFPHGFMFLRLTDLRGFEEVMLDFAEEPPELQMLIDVVLGHNVRKLEKLLAQREPPGLLGFGDDLGMQNSLPMSPEKWRKFLKPCYERIYGPCRERGFSVAMHSDGHIVEIIPDLIECGVQVINPQIRANGLENLARVCKGRVCVNLDLDRQMFPFCKPQAIDPHVREAVEALGSPQGGLWLSAECGPDVPLENIEAICVALEKRRAYYAH